MTFIHRFGISVALAAIIPLFVIDYSLPAAYETHLMFICTVVWLFMIPLAMYSSPIITVRHDEDGNPVPVFLREASSRTLIGRCTLYVSASVFLAFLVFASYAIAEKYEVVVIGPVLAFGPIGAYLYFTAMCPYCKKLNPPNLRQCVNCGNALLPNAFQDKIESA